MKTTLFLQLFLLIFTLNSYGKTKVTTAEVYFRSTPEMIRNKICIIPKGTQLTIIDCGIRIRGWLIVQYKGKVGYVSSAYAKHKSTTRTKTRTQPI